MHGNKRQGVVAMRVTRPDDEAVLLEGPEYLWRQANPERTQRYFREAPGRRRTHIHVRKLGSWHEQYALLFRDYLRPHPEDQRHYKGVKRRLALEHRNDRHTHTDAKGDIFVESYPPR